MERFDAILNQTADFQDLVRRLVEVRRQLEELQIENEELKTRIDRLDATKKPPTT